MLYLTIPKVDSAPLGLCCFYIDLLVFAGSNLDLAKALLNYILILF